MCVVLFTQCTISKVDHSLCVIYSECEFEPYSKPPTQHSLLSSDTDGPREHAPKPFLYHPGNTVADLSNIDKISNGKDLINC